MRFPRLDFPGARHHVMNRGARREVVFATPETRELFLGLLADLPVRFGVIVHGYALMPNHYHLLLESGRGGLPRAMRHVGGEFSRQLNRRHGWDGPLFRGRYRNRIVETEAAWRYLLLYVHSNPVRAGISDAGTAAWTSHGAYLALESCPVWLRTEDLLRLFGSREAYAEAWADMVSGRLQAPAEVVTDRLWRPQATGVARAVGETDSSLGVQRALSDVSRVTGLPVEKLVGPVGRGNRNPARAVAAWWMSRRCGIDHGRIAGALGIGHDALSRIVRRVEERRASDARIGTWLDRLAVLTASGR